MVKKDLSKEMEKKFKDTVKELDYVSQVDGWDGSRFQIDRHLESENSSMSINELIDLVPESNKKINVWVSQTTNIFSEDDDEANERFNDYKGLEKKGCNVRLDDSSGSPTPLVEIMCSKNKNVSENELKKTIDELSLDLERIVPDPENDRKMRIYKNN